VALQWILGLRPEIDGLRIDPCIPAGWAGFRTARIFRGNRIEVTIRNPASKNRGVRQLEVDGRRIDGNLLPVTSMRHLTRVQAVLEGS
jgi:cellobiose phosphorylase